MGGAESDLYEHTLGQSICELERAIYAKRPVLGDIIAKHGNKNLYTYTLDFLDINTNEALDIRRNSFLDIVYDHVQSTLGKSIAHEVCKQLRAKPLVSTIDHHGIIDHPFFVNANIVGALPYDVEHLPYIVVFSFASVSLNNASAFPRGILFHSGKDGVGDMIKLPLMPDKMKMSTVYNTPGYTPTDVAKMISLLDTACRKGDVSDMKCAAIKQFIDQHIAIDSLYNTSSLSAQIAKINYSIWPHYFADFTGPRLVYIEGESLVADILLRSILGDTNHLLYKMLFDPHMRNIALDAFDGIPGAFSRQEQRGTYFFRGLDAKGHRVRLFVDDAFLSSYDGHIHLLLEPDTIADALRNKLIFPSMLSIYSLVSLYYGMKCLGGFSQVHDLTLMKAALEKILTTIGDMDELHTIQSIQTKEFGGDGIVLSYNQLQNNRIIPMTGIDMYLSDKKLSFTDYRAIAKQVTLSELMLPMFPEIYTVLYPITQRVPHLAAISIDDIMSFSGLQEKIPKLLRQYGLLYDV